MESWRSMNNPIQNVKEKLTKQNLKTFLLITFGTFKMCIRDRYGILLTLTAYFSRIYTIDQRLSFRELILAIIACFFETTFLRFYLAFVRVTASVSYTHLDVYKRQMQRALRKRWKPTTNWNGSGGWIPAETVHPKLSITKWSIQYDHTDKC